VIAGVAGLVAAVIFAFGPVAAAPWTTACTSIGAVVQSSC
jgi:hypothetical protein